MKKVYFVFFTALLGSALILGSSHAGYTQESDKVDYNLSWAPSIFVPVYAYSSHYMATNLFTGQFDRSNNAPLTAWSSDMKNTMREDQYTFKARLASKKDSPVKWVAGTFYLASINQPFTIAGVGETYKKYDNKQPASSLGVFGQATYPVTDLFRVTGGLRYTMDNKSFDYGFDSIVNPVYNTDLTTYKNFYSTTTYKAGMEYDLKKDSMLYTHISTSDRAVGYSTTASPSKIYKPEKLLAYEIGIKNQLSDNRMQINAEGYLYNYKDYRVQFPLQRYYAISAENIPFNSGVTKSQQYIANAKSVKSYGADLELNALVTSNDRLDATLSYRHAKYENMSQTIDISPASTLSSGTPFILADTQVASSLEWSGTLGYQHIFDLQNGGIIIVRGQSKISAGSWSTIEKNLENAWQDGVHSSDANISYAPSTDDWLVNAWINNIENNNQKTTVTPLYRMTITDPRTYGATLTVKW